MSRGSIASVALLLTLLGSSAEAESPKAAERLLQHRLDKLESQVIQRQGRGERVRDLLTRQDDRIAGQALNTLKTREPRTNELPFLERQLDRSRRPTRLFRHR